MTQAPDALQRPAPDSRRLYFRGDTLTFSLTLPQAPPGEAWLRTNLGQAPTQRREIRAQVERGIIPMARDWADIPMTQVDETTFRLRLPLAEVGHFEAKTYFLPQGSPEPLWPPGGNTVINVSPAEGVSGNIIYNAFVRQFGPNKAEEAATDGGLAECVQRLDQAQYTVIPRSGTFRDLIGELDFIIDTLGCRFIQLLPIHPTPTTYARMGRFGSPYASLSFTAVDPALAEFDPAVTPMEQFLELADAIHARGGRLLLDIAINHTGWAAQLHETHPEWLARKADGSIKRPGAWGVTWEDLTELDFSHRELWRFMAKVFLTWCRRGADGFRCDAGYMIPIPAWTYIIARVREQYPDTIFLLEGLGGKISVTRELLNRGGFDWAYSELFQNYDRAQIEAYLPGAHAISAREGLTVHFVETHDNNRLAARSPAWAALRTALCALCAPQGAFGFANGVEWLATEKIVVHEAPSLNWGAGENLVALIRRLSAILRDHPAFHERVALDLLQEGEGNVLALRRRCRGLEASRSAETPEAKSVLVLANLDPEHPGRAQWRREAFDLPGGTALDLVSSRPLEVSRGDHLDSLELAPAQVLCLSSDADDLKRVEKAPSSGFRISRHLARQRARAKVLDILSYFKGLADLGDLDLTTAADQFLAQPLEFCRRNNPWGDEPRVITWQWPADARRVVMLPPGHFLLVRAPHRFRARLMIARKTLAQEEALKNKAGYFALFAPLPTPQSCQEMTLKVWCYERGVAQRRQGTLQRLPDPGRALPYLSGHYADGQKSDPALVFLSTNGRGAMCRARVRWGSLASRYDALLAANLHPEYPVDRHIMFTRCRAWIRYQGYSRALDESCLESFQDYGTWGQWRFHLPAGQGQEIYVSLSLAMIPGCNQIAMLFQRAPGQNRPDSLADGQAVHLILRPDIEDRSFHHQTKAYLGPESAWPPVVSAESDGFRFSPAAERRLQVRLVEGQFTLESEWSYMVHLAEDAQRGFDPHCDLFSPGYFNIALKGGRQALLTARVGEEPESNVDLGSLPDPALRVSAKGLAESPRLNLPQALARAMDAFVVRRDESNTVIAGYPWFLDWGRDTLIFARGLVAAGRYAETLELLRQFGRFEDRGTLPNMIHGETAANRDTSDAPLWYFTVAADLAAATGSMEFLDLDCGGRPLKAILAALARAMVDGTPNGVRMDPDSALIYSPAHYTWMDTNFPAGTPRAGYPVEIQALWHAALNLAARCDPERRWKALQRTAGRSLKTLFWHAGEGFLADCLHGAPGCPAAQATADDHLRGNQLFAITLGALGEPALGRRILAACEQLLVPGAIRSLADRPVQHPLAIHHQGQLLNDPHHPYQRIYGGDEDTRRKPAYHNGTAWTWPFPAYAEAWVEIYGPSARTTALAWLGSALPLMGRGCVGQLPEILDGDAPHAQRGCDAQAWGASEFYRVWRKLTPGSPEASSAPAPAAD
jgi:predicted glycogen debranching enzyme